MKRGIAAALARLFVLLPAAMALCLLNAACVQSADFIRWVRSKEIP